MSSPGRPVTNASSALRVESIAVTPSSSGAVQILCRVDPDRAGKFRFTAETNGTVSVEGRRRSPSLGDLKVQIVAQIPDDCALDVRAAGGSIDVGRHGGPIVAEVKGGSIKIARAVESLTISASAAVLRSTRCRGP